ncbi:unnamed protein product [Somion occarium]|uniref:Large ribosomal subunit protein mL59 domain-containing protein n=1 Tax=Somion occarium TaxID=3059160 RepID=A0ABP1CXY4_9APHY
MALQAIKTFRTRELSAVLKTLQLSETAPTVPNPFLPRLNPESGRWAPAKYSLRQQADLIKQAKVSNTLHLLPPGPKLPPTALQKVPRPESLDAEPWSQNVVWEGEVKEKKKVSGPENGIRMYAGRKKMFKGHKWERTLEKRVTKRKWLMRGMKARILRFKTTYKRRRPSPLGPARVTGKQPKLPY